MSKGPQPKNEWAAFRFKAMVNANYPTYKALHTAVQQQVKKKINYRSFVKVMAGIFLSGPKPALIMQMVSELLGMPVDILWPREERVARAA